MRFQPALFRLAHWSELVKPGGYFLLLTVGLAFFPIPFWAGLLVGIVVGGGAFLRERFAWVRDTPQCIEVTPDGLTLTARLSAPRSVAWKAVRKVTADDELGGWRIETADQVLRFGVAGLSLKEMAAIEAAIRENAERYQFQLQHQPGDAISSGEARAAKSAASQDNPPN